MRNSALSVVARASGAGLARASLFLAQARVAVEGFSYGVILLCFARAPNARCISSSQEWSSVP